ncbi:MAG: DNA polymerase III subunit delta [Pseudochelatococcus sp.]|jgi:DNA polymerase-3 subunit delta|uniref:DNA polymerase III subunit delta n=1 Tax=Pseudochelatococcus sp. TaxID=2020869 RepID=UPI003D8A610A
MVAVKAGDVERVLAKPDPKAVVFLVYGPDTGLVSERARRLAESVVDDPSDPFQMVRLEGDDVAADPLRLADEANTIGLFGGRRAIRVSASSRNLAPALAPLFAAPPQDAVVVVEAGDLPRSSPLRTACERSASALAIPCYADGTRDIAALVDATLRDHGLAIGPDARGALVALLGGDRVASRSEIEKLALYARGQSEVTLADVHAVVGDVSALAVDAVVDAVFGGDQAALDVAFMRLMREGFDAGVLLGFVLRHALTLLPARLAIENGDSAPAAQVEGMRSLHFRRKAAVERQLRLWPHAHLVRVARDLGTAIAATRRNATLAEALAQKALWPIAAAARRAATRA